MEEKLYGTSVKCGCGKTYESNLQLKDNDETTCCYCHSYGYFRSTGVPTLGVLRKRKTLFSKSIMIKEKLIKRGKI